MVRKLVLKRVQERPTYTESKGYSDRRKEETKQHQNSLETMMFLWRQVDLLWDLGLQRHVGRRIGDLGGVVGVRSNSVGRMGGYTDYLGRLRV